MRCRVFSMISIKKSAEGLTFCRSVFCKLCLFQSQGNGGLIADFGRSEILDSTGTDIAGLYGPLLSVSGEVGERLACMAAKEIAATGFFDGIDIIIPLPLSKKKKRRRGYNQSDYIAKGISRATGIPVVTDAVVREKSNETQTHKNRDERWKNVEGIFKLAAPEKLEGKHILLIDDILTTGATLCSCASSIQHGCNCRTSIFTIAYTYNGI